MSLSIVDQLQAQWEARRVELDPPAKDDREFGKELYKLLAQCTDAGKQITDRPERFRLQGLARQIGDTIFRVMSEYPDTVIAPAERSLDAQLTLGISALPELMQDHPLRVAVADFQTHFQAMRQQIDLLADYKKLHDLLHELQFRYDPLVQETRRVPADTRWEDVEMYAFDLEMIIRRLHDVMSRPSFQLNEDSWVRDLEQAQEGLAEAVQNRAHNRLQRAVWLMKRVASIQPSIINTRLNTVYRAMQVPELLRTMTRLRDQLDLAHVEVGKQHKLSNAIDNVERLLERLTALVMQHDVWQAIDDELRLIDEVTEQDASALVDSWPYVKVKADRLYRTVTDTQAVSWSETLAEMDRCIADGDVARLNRTFQRFRQRARFEFYEVDRSLMTLCDSLRVLGEPLSLLFKDR
jgi:hypothetical protein